ncbi:hypothetical protein RFI_38067, partial [Reticulomyxa filosa]
GARNGKFHKRKKKVGTTRYLNPKKKIQNEIFFAGFGKWNQNGSPKKRKQKIPILPAVNLHSKKKKKKKRKGQVHQRDFLSSFRGCLAHDILWVLLLRILRVWKTDIMRARCVLWILGDIHIDIGALGGFGAGLYFKQTKKKKKGCDQIFFLKKLYIRPKKKKKKNTKKKFNKIFLGKGKGKGEGKKNVLNMMMVMMTSFFASLATATQRNANDDPHNDTNNRANNSTNATRAGTMTGPGGIVTNGVVCGRGITVQTDVTVVAVVHSAQQVAGIAI